MKPLKESFIKAKDLDRLNRWPNPYNLTEKDIKGDIKGFPLEIITLVLNIAKKERGDDYNINDLCYSGVNYAFGWDNTKEGYEFWKSISNKKFDVFYNLYTPTKLKERLKEK